jgi:predicted dinucleotide-binding enzyme
MKIGILGSDARALASGRLLVDADYDVAFEEAGNVASSCEILILAGPRENMDTFVDHLENIGDRSIVVDAMEGTLPPGPDGSALLARALDTRRVVRALISVPQAGTSVLMCGDDEDAKATVGVMFRAAGCVTTDRGPLANAREIEGIPSPNSVTGETTFETLKDINNVGV